MQRTPRASTDFRAGLLPRLCFSDTNFLVIARYYAAFSYRLPNGHLRVRDKYSCISCFSCTHLYLFNSTPLS